jgi:hypothetical protein
MSTGRCSLLLAFGAALPLVAALAQGGPQDRPPADPGFR